MAEFDVLRKKAEWAATFNPESFDKDEGTNLSQRYRYAQDQDMYAKAKDLVDQQEQQILLQNNPGARDLYFRQRNLEMKSDRDQFEMGLKQEQHEMKERMFPMELELKAASVRATAALERHRLADETRKAEIATKTMEDTEGFAAGAHELMVKGYMPGSKELAEGIARLAVKHPFVPDADRASWFKEARIKKTPTELLLEGNKLTPEMRARVTASVDSDGDWRMSFAPAAAGGTPPPDKPDTYKAFNEELAEMVKSYTGEEALSFDKIKRPDPVPPAEWAKFEARRAALGTTQAPASAATAKTSISQAEYDALESGAEFSFNGRRGKKP